MNFRRDILDVKFVSFTHDDHGPDTITQLADVAGPTIICKDLLGGSGNGFYICTYFVNGFFQEKCYKAWYVFDSVA